MKIKIILVSILLLLFTIFASGCLPFMEKIGLINPTDEEQLSPEKASSDGLVKVLIGFKEKPGQAQQAMVKGVGGKIKYTYHLIPAIAAAVPEASIAGLKANPNVTYLEMDGLVYALDDELDNSWGVKRIGAGFVHDSGNRGEGVKVAIIDSGIDYTHPDLQDNCADENLNGIIDGYDFVNDDDDPMDDYGHGTHVAGTVAAEDDGEGVVGVAPAADLYALKVLDETGRGYVSDIVAAIEWCADNYIHVTNNSYGSSGDPGESLKDAFDNASGVLHVAAAGNSGNPPGRGDNIIYPARYESVIAVAATDQNDKRASWSSTGPDLELSAPGVAINSTLLGGGYGEGNGTSMASPHVAGTAALMIAAGISDVRGQLQDTAEDLGAEGRDSQFGYGLVNAAEAATPTDTTPPAKVTGLTVTTVSCAQLDLAWDANTEGDLDHYNVYRSTTSGGLYDLIASPTTYLYSDVELTAMKTYYYVVTAVNTSGNEGEKSVEASGTTSADDLGPVTSDVVADPNPTNGAASVTLTANISDVTTGNTMIATAEYFLGTVGADGSGTPMSASDSAFDSSTEGVTASIDVFAAGWVAGQQYTLYVHGQDTAGNWGDTKSVVLEVTEESSNIMYVESIVFSSKVAGPNKFLYTTVEVVNGDSIALEGVRVEMTLYHQELDDTWYFAGDTGADGTVKFTLNKAPSGSYIATVTGLTLSGYDWNEGPVESDLYILE